MRPLRVGGLGLWTPGFPSIEAWTSGERTAATDPPCAGVPSNALRGTGVCARVAIEVALQAMRAAGADPATTPTIFSSGLGEVQTAVALSELVDQSGSSSPIRFKNSVHNSSGGNFAVALRNRAFSTSLSAGDDLVAMALLEAWGWLDAHDGDLVVVFGEEAIPTPLPGHGTYPPLGLALHLSADLAPDAAVLSDLRRVTGVAPETPRAPHAGHDVAWALPLIEALAARRPATVALGPGDAPWVVTVA